MKQTLVSGGHDYFLTAMHLITGYLAILIKMLLNCVLIELIIVYVMHFEHPYVGLILV